MSFAPQADRAGDAQAGPDTEVLDALPVLAGEPETLRVRPVSGALVRSRGGVIPAVQAAAVAAGGFVAGAAVVGLVQRRQRHSASAARRGRRGGARSGRSSAPGGELLQIVSSRSLLVDVHLLGPAGPQR